MKPAATIAQPNGNLPAPRRPAEPTARELQRILCLSVPVTVSLAERQMTIGTILGLHVGTIIEFEVPFDAELTLHVANRAIAQGQAVKVGEKFGLRINRIGSVEERIDVLGAGATAHPARPLR